MLLVMLVGCSPSSQTPGSTTRPAQDLTSPPVPTLAPTLSDGITLVDTQEVVDKMKALCCEDGWWNHLSDAENKSSEAKRNGEELDIGAAFLENLEAVGQKFDVNEYFTVLTHLAPEDGYVLDYVYFGPGGDGFPRVYARREGESAFANYAEYEKANLENYLSHVRVDGTAEGYFELAVLSIMGGQFYLAWHAAYADKEVVSSRERVEAIIDQMNEAYTPLTEEQVEAFLKLDVTPRVKFKGEEVRLRILVFTKWGGFFERVYTIDRDFPHQMVDEDVELVPYTCGVMF